MTAYLSQPTGHPGDVGDSLLQQVLDSVRETERGARTARRNARRNERNRIGMLTIHGRWGVAIAATFPLIGQVGMAGPSWDLARKVPGAPYTMAGVLGAGAIVLMCSARGKHRVAAFIGLVLMGAFYATMALSFGGAFLHWLIQAHPTSPLRVLEIAVSEDRAKPTPYAGLLYAHWANVMIKHIITLSRLASDDRHPES